MTVDRMFLLASAAGLTPIALGYGIAPSVAMPALFGFPVEDPSLTHIFRAVMGLYLALAGFWLVAAFDERLRAPALWSLILFMFGLAAGRALSLVLDGMPHWLLFAYLVLELVFGIAGVRMLRLVGDRAGHRA